MKKEIIEANQTTSTPCDGGEGKGDSLPEIDQLLEKLDVRTRDSDFNTLRKMVEDALKGGSQNAMETRRHSAGRTG